jgi:hypothetical protein
MSHFYHNYTPDDYGYKIFHKGKTKHVKELRDLLCNKGQSSLVNDTNET